MSTDAVSSIGAGGTNMRDYPLYLKRTTGTPIEYDAEDFRQYALQYERSGVLGTGDFKVTQDGSGSTKVSIAAGRAIIQGNSDATNQGKYLVRSTAPVLLTLPAAPSSGTRAYRIVAQVRDGAETGTDYDWVFDYVEGPDTAGTFPDEPASAVTVAKVTRSAGVASILTAAIADYRWRAKLEGVSMSLGYTDMVSGSSAATDNPGTHPSTEYQLIELQLSGVTLVAGYRYVAKVLVHYSAVNPVVYGQYRVRVGSAGGTAGTQKGFVQVSTQGNNVAESVYFEVAWVQATTAYAQFVSVTHQRVNGNTESWVTQAYANGNSHIELIER